MIVPMKKITLLSQDMHKDETLRVLQNAGLMHLCAQEVEADPGVEQSEYHVQRLQQVLAALDMNTGHAAPAQASSAWEIASFVWDCLQRLRTIQDRRQALEQEQERIRPFGTFSPQSVQALRDAGCEVKLYSLPGSQSVIPPREAVMIEISADRNARYVALFSQKSVNLDAQEVPLPEQGLREIEDELSALRTEREEVLQAISECSVHRSQMEDLLVQARDRSTYQRARAGMEIHADLAAVQGYLPARDLPSMQELAQKSGWGLHIQDPEPEDDPPTLIDVPQWVRPIKAVFSAINILPGYRETDISAPFLLFLSLFFAMIIGDAGYGALFLGITLAARRPLQRIHSHLVPFLLIMSGCTVVWGLLTGNIFGLSVHHPVLTNLQVEWLTGAQSDDRLMFLCFLIGALHLSLAHIWRLILLWPSPRVLAQIGWILITWGMFSAACTLVLFHHFPDVMILALGLGFILVVGFMRPLRELASQWTDFIRLPLDVISQFVDVVSYVRLFAVGTATVAVAQAFNQMALSLGFEHVLSGLGAALILFLGHSMNIALAGMGVLVHGVRLNTLEFATHAGITWSGRAYQPFAQNHTRSGGSRAVGEKRT